MLLLCCSIVYNLSLCLSYCLVWRINVFITSQSERESRPRRVTGGCCGARADILNRPSLCRSAVELQRLNESARPRRRRPLNEEQSTSSQHDATVIVLLASLLYHHFGKSLVLRPPLLLRFQLSWLCFLCKLVKMLSV